MMIVLIDKSPELIRAWKQVFPKNTGIMQADILDFETIPVLVAPGNSSGAMTGGLDLAIAQKWPGIESQVRNHAIIEVGESVVLPLLISTTFRYLIYTPTMRGAMDVSETENAYIAMKAILKHKDLGTIAIPGLCAGVGKMPVKKVAEQMVRAYTEHLDD